MQDQDLIKENDTLRIEYNKLKSKYDNLQLLYNNLNLLQSPVIRDNETLRNDMTHIIHRLKKVINLPISKVKCDIISLIRDLEND